MEPTEPQTKAGRLLLERLEWAAQRHEVEPVSALDLAERSIIAIEREAVALYRKSLLDRVSRHGTKLSRAKWPDDHLYVLRSAVLSLIELDELLTPDVK